MVSLTVTGTNRVIGKFRLVASTTPKALDAAIGEFAKRTRARLRSTKYPPKRPNQRYKRTGRLGRSWKASRLKPAVWAIDNTASVKSRPYAMYVVGPRSGAIGKRQAWMHKGRWWVAEEEVEKSVLDLRRAIIKELKLGS